MVVNSTQHVELFGRNLRIFVYRMVCNKIISSNKRIIKTMKTRIPYLTEFGDDKYTIINDYDHIIASLDVAIDNIFKAHSLIDEKNSISLTNMQSMKLYCEKNLTTLAELKANYMEDRELFIKIFENNVLA